MPAAGETPATCSFRFQANVQPATTYRIVPGTRDALDRTADELAAAGWTIAITLTPEP
jgi:hypothetical protein